MRFVTHQLVAPKNKKREAIDDKKCGKSAANAFMHGQKTRITPMFFACFPEGSNPFTQTNYAPVMRVHFSLIRLEKPHKS